MTSQRVINISRYILVVINFLAIWNIGMTYLLSSKYIVAHHLSQSLLENLEVAPQSPTLVFFTSLGGYLCLVGVIYLRARRTSIGLLMLEIFLMLSVFVTLQYSYNGIILLVFLDIFYSLDYTILQRKRSWALVLFISSLLLLLSDNDVLSSMIKIPDVDTYLNFYADRTQFGFKLIKNLLYSLNLVAFFGSFIFYIVISARERQEMQEKLQEISKINEDLNAYADLTEKITEDRERKRIAREIHDTLGHALTGISSGMDAVSVLIDMNPDKAKEQVNKMSLVVRNSIQDVRRSLNRLRPEALEGHTLRGALENMLVEYQSLSKLKIEFIYDWGDADLDITTEDIIFRAIQESVTNSLRHGHANQVVVHCYQDEHYYRITIRDDGMGCEHINVGYGLMQMKERLSMVGGSVIYDGSQGFLTQIIIPRTKGTNHD
ncbi:sensor histidine kinase [Streptococcus dentapri]|uniref:histidine kinase n=1 Tax=Streptococcus dentapri TaxID=573564 RepID=A0ABV8CZY2_9STRE